MHQSLLLDRATLGEKEKGKRIPLSKDDRFIRMSNKIMRLPAGMVPLGKCLLFLAHFVLDSGKRSYF